jgi:hypothetical protein
LVKHQWCIHKLFTQECLQFSTQINMLSTLVCEIHLMALAGGCNMNAMKRWAVVGSSGALCVSLAWAAMPTAAPAALQNRSGGGESEASVAAVPDASSSRFVPAANEATQRAAGGRPSPAQASATRPVEEARISLGQMLASWGLVACIALRRIFD